jgi:hypothetical protein
LQRSIDMAVRLVLSAAMVCLMAPGMATAATDPTLFRLFLTDGTTIISYGEFARLDDRVIFSMPAGGAADQPRLHAVTLPAVAIDWPRTDKYAASARYQRYADTRGEDDFLHLSNDVAGVLNQILQTTDRMRALEIAMQARTTLVNWPRDHYGYRQQDVREILSLLDEAIAGLRAAAGMTMFDVALVADPPDVALEPIAGMPSFREQLDQVLHVAAFTERSSERIALFQVGLALLDEARSSFTPIEIAASRRFIETRIREEVSIDAGYATLSRRLVNLAARAAARASIADVQRVLDSIPREDGRLGRKRPEVIDALHASVQSQLVAAQRLRLLRDQWLIRRSLYRDYQRSIGTQVLQLVKAQPSLDAIRRLAGPSPSTLVSLRGRFAGGAERLQRLQVPADVRAVHDLVIGAWRFAETAFNGRYQAIESGEVTTAWEASSAAAGALLFLSRAQQEIRELLEPPQLR